MRPLRVDQVLELCEKHTTTWPTPPPNEAALQPARDDEVGLCAGGAGDGNDHVVFLGNININLFKRHLLDSQGKREARDGPAEAAHNL